MKSSVNVSEWIDRKRLSPFQIRVIALCSLLAMLDGFDAQVISFVAPVIADAWHIKVAAFGPVFGIGMFGLALGSLIFGRSPT